MFITTSIEIMEIKLILNAVYSADLNSIPLLLRIIISKITLVIKPLIMASESIING